MLVRYSLVCHPELKLQEDLKGEWYLASDVEAALKGVIKEIAYPHNGDNPGPSEALDRAAVALEARREKIIALEKELAERNKEVERAIRLAENVSR